MTKEEKKQKVAANLLEAKNKYIQANKGRVHPNQMKVMVLNKFGKY